MPHVRVQRCGADAYQDFIVADRRLVAFTELQILP